MISDCLFFLDPCVRLPNLNALFFLVTHIGRVQCDKQSIPHLQTSIYKYPIILLYSPPSIMTGIGFSQKQGMLCAQATDEISISSFLPFSTTIDSVCMSHKEPRRGWSWVYRVYFISVCFILRGFDRFQSYFDFKISLLVYFTSFQEFHITISLYHHCPIRLHCH